MGALSSRLRAWLGPSLGLASVCLAPEAAAAGSRYRFELVRADGAGSCPAAAEIEREVTARLGRNPFSPTGERGIEVVLERAEPVWRARLYLRLDPSEPDQVRTLESEAQGCAELTRSVTLAVSLAIAPDLPPEPEAEPAPAAALPCPPAPPPPLPPSSLHGAATVRALYSPQLLPGASSGGAIVLSLRGSLFGAAFGGLFFPENELRSGGTRLGFGLSSAFASGCLWARSADPQLWSCLGARVGALHTVVYSPSPQRPGDRFWAAATSELGLRQHLLSRLFVEAGAAAVFPLLRHRFLVDADSAPIYEQGAAMVEAFVGLGLELR